MDSIQVLASAFLSREIVSWLKGHGYLANNVVVMLSNYLTSGIVAFAIGLLMHLGHGDITTAVVKGLLTGILATVYHNISSIVSGMQSSAPVVDQTGQ